MVGGVKRTENVKQSQGIPGLKSIPVLGWLFGGETKIDRESDVAMVLTPSVYIGAASDMEMPANAQTIVGAAMNEAQAEIPANPLGFDQWLLDPEK
ncbi:MAG: Bacterial type II and III secretion system protein [candidate division BRC1 bacterium ADurb.BinA364]|nr:MAG: Bacterial type II and III secretion system protein [candidate division BRC1 bacterium ADurb.BinA364]